MRAWLLLFFALSTCYTFLIAWYRLWSIMILIGILHCFPSPVAFSLTAAPLTSPQTSQTLEVNNDRQTKNSKGFISSPTVSHADSHFSFPKETVSFLDDRLCFLDCSWICFYFWELQEMAMWNEWPFPSFILKKNRNDKLVPFQHELGIFFSFLQLNKVKELLKIFLME